MRLPPALPLALAFALVLPRPAGASETDFVAEQIHALASGDAEARARASKELVRAGTPALEALRASLAGAEDPAVRARLETVVAEIGRREPKGLVFRCRLPRLQLTPEVVNGKDFRFLVEVRNRNDETVVLWPYFELEVRDAEGRALDPSRRLGRFGLRRGACFLEDVPFVTIEPGATWSCEVGLAHYGRDPRWITGWKIPAAGTYTLAFTYAYDRAATRQRCPQDWEPLDDPKRPWNLAVELEHSFTAELEVGD